MRPITQRLPGVKLFGALPWYVQAKTVFSLHSPQLFSFGNAVLDDSRWYYAFDDIEQARTRLLQQEGNRQIGGFAGARPSASTDSRSVARVHRQSVSSSAKGRLLFRLAHWYKPDIIIEWGTSLGISAAYLSSADRRVPVLTIDRSADVQEVAGRLWEALSLHQIRSICSPFDQAWPLLPSLQGQRVLFYLDGHHQSGPTQALLAAFRDKCDRPFAVLIDDIRWSADMYTGWKEWSSSPRPAAWLDLFQTGLYLDDPAFLQPVRMSLISRSYKPFRLGWI